MPLGPGEGVSPSIHEPEASLVAAEAPLVAAVVYAPTTKSTSPGSTLRLTPSHSVRGAGGVPASISRARPVATKLISGRGCGSGNPHRTGAVQPNYFGSTSGVALAQMLQQLRSCVPPAAPALRRQSGRPSATPTRAHASQAAATGAEAPVRATFNSGPTSAAPGLLGSAPASQPHRVVLSGVAGLTRRPTAVASLVSLQPFHWLCRRLAGPPARGQGSRLAPCSHAALADCLRRAAARSPRWLIL